MAEVRKLMLSHSLLCAKESSCESREEKTTETSSASFSGGSTDSANINSGGARLISCRSSDPASIWGPFWSIFTGAPFLRNSQLLFT